jgi:YD repeat-containing protein
LDRLTAQTDPLGHTTTFSDDPAGAWAAVTDAAGHKTIYAYDRLGRLETVTSATGGVTTTVYDKSDNVVGTVDPLNHRTTAVYDALDRAIRSIDANGGVTTLAYDANDNLTQVIDPALNATAFAYDELDRLTARTDPRTQPTTYAYDTASRLTSMTDRLGRRTDYRYDDADRPTGQTWYAAGGSVQDVLTFTYDAVGNQTGAANGAGAYVLTYDELDRVKSVQEPFGLALTFTYDAAGNRTRVTDSKGGVATSVYDEANRLTSRQFSDGASQLRFDYTYTARDQVETLTRYANLAGTTQVGQTTYAYDTAGRTTQVKHKDAAGTWFQTLAYTYESTSGRLLAETRNGDATTYTYDAADQLTGDGTRSYGYDAAGNRDTAGYATDAGNRMTADGTSTYPYDDEGNLTRKTRVSDGTYWEYTYNHANQMTSAKHYTAAGALDRQVDYAYDAWGNLIQRTEDPDGAGAQAAAVERYGVDGWKTQQDFWGNAAQHEGQENFDVWADLSGANALTARRLALDDSR